MSKYGRVMKKCNKFYNNPKKEELYSLDSTILAFLIPRLEEFLTVSSNIIDWDWHKDTDDVDVVRSVKKVIKKLRYVQENRDTFDVKESKKCERYIHEAFEILSDIYFYLWY